MILSRKQLAISRSMIALMASATALHCGDDPDPPVTTKPTISAFSADPDTVEAGQTTVLKYTVTNATSVRIDIMGGANVLPASATLSGMVTTPALNANTVFVLTASNGSDTSTRNLTVTVNNANRAVITSFTANPTTVDVGSSSTLSWETMNATSGMIREGNTVLLDAIDAEMLAEGTFTLEDLRVSRTITLVMKGADGTEVTDAVQITVNGPQVLTFLATPGSINAGESSDLTWNVRNSSNVSISGSISGNVLPNGAVPTGSLSVTPTATEEYTITASDDAGNEDTAVVTVTVNAPQGAQITDFSASPSSIDLGQFSTLSWSVTNAPGGIEISDGTTVVHTNAALTGTFEVRPFVDTTYTLTAINPAGNATDTQIVTLNPSAPAILSFTASPNPVGANNTTRLQWETRGADQVRILRGATVEVDTTTNLDTGLLETLVTTSTTFVLEATNASGGNTSTIFVVAHDNPVINSFTVSPNAFSGSSTTAVVTWDVSNTSHLELFANGVPAPGFTPVDTGTTAGALQGSFSLSISVATTFELVATSAAGTANQSARVSVLVIETEPNNTSSTAVPLVGDGGPANGAIDPAGDIDLYSVIVSAGGSVRAETSNGAGDCDADTIISLIGSDGTTVLASNDDGGIGSCSLIDPAAVGAARDLAAGTYYILVEHYDSDGLPDPDEVGPYTLNVLVSAAACGNRLRETRATVAEQCDDGNAVGGDGCSATCQIEPLQTLTGPGLVETPVAGSIGVVGEVDYIQITMLAEGYVRAETFAPASPNCGSDTVIRLLDSAFVQLGEDDEDGVGSCSLINPATDAFAHVQAGTYYVSVEDYLNNGTISAYTLNVTLLGVGCGNGVLEAGETCDDSNGTNGDGCSATCSFEGLNEDEAGGNNTFNGAGVLTATTDIVYQGSLDPATDFDFYAVTVPQGFHLDVSVTVNSFDSCAANPEPRGQLQLLGTNGTTVLGTNSTGGANGNCGRIWPSTDIDAYDMDAGTYYIRVGELDANAIAPAYFLHVRIIAPACGNEIFDVTEECEDGNTAAGDGCSATCEFEINPTVIVPPSGVATVNLGTATSFSLIQVEITTPGQSIAAVAADSPGATTCNTIDTVVQFGNADLELLGEVFDGGPTGTAGDCAAIIPTLDDFARDLEVGTYFILVFNETGVGTGSVDVSVTIADPACGNSLVETNDGEACDDGNVANGDGCNSVCAFEPVGTATLPSATAITFNNAIVPASQVDVYQLTVTADVYLTAATFIPTAPSCTGGDTVMRLYDSTMTEIAVSDDVGFTTCSRIDFAGYDEALLTVGTYFLSIEEYDLNDEIAAYALVVSGVNANVCGNGIQEGTEACDDGNVTSGDGCSATCTIDGVVINEAEPNNSGTAAQSLGTFAPGAIFDIGGAAITPLADNDWYTFTLSAATTAFIGTHLTAGNLNTCGGDTQIWLYNSATPVSLTTTTVGGDVVAYDDDDGAGACSWIDGLFETPVMTPINLAAGQYWLRIHEYADDATITAYRVRMDF
jgi:cysteine-rich repeat protein